MTDAQDQTDAPLIAARDPLQALMLLSRLPLPGGDDQRAADAAWAWPIAGAVLGMLSALVATAALWVGLPPAAAAGLALVALAMMTGGLHEDGLADCADGFWGGATADRRLEIMRDSRIGSYGVIALVLVIGLKWVALTTLFAAGYVWAALLLPAMASRAAIAGVMSTLPFARDDGLAKYVGQPSVTTAALAGGVAVLCALLIGGGAAFLLLAVIGLLVGGIRMVARAKIGGQTGDVLGATQMLSEAAALLALTAIWS